MAEPKRLEFTTISPTQKPKKKVSCSPPSQRFSLTLTDSTEATCPEFSYTELVKNAVRKKERGGGDPDDPFAEEEDEGKLEAIAKAFEAKYGPKVKTKKGRPSDRVRDLVDLGDGYDETDDFIDNTEAYDEIVPRCLTTKLGGFYINSGMLDFRYASEDSADDFQKSSPMKKKRKIRTIESDSDSNSEVKKRGPKKRKLKEGVDVEKKRKKKMMIGPDGEKIVVKRGRKPLDKNKLKKKTSPTVSELLKQQTASTSTPTHAVNGAGDSSLMHNNSDEGYNLYDNTNIGSTIEMLLREDSESREGDDEKKPEIATALPMGMPERLVQTLNDIKKAAKQSREGKCKFFSGGVNKMLLDIEMQSRQLSCSNRQAVYSHLSCFLPCGKETLLKRAKKLRLSQQDDLLRDPINKLKEAVNLMMPTLLEKYDAESQLAALMRMENKEKTDSDTKETKEEGSTESDDEELKDGEKKKRIMGPRKKFEWTDHVRSLLCDVVRVKMKTFAAAKQRGQTAEEYIKFFLDMEIRLIWPAGWMQTRMLYKESRAIHGMWTNPQKQRKSLQGPGKTASPTPNSVPFGARSNSNSIIEIFDNVENDTMKEGEGSDKELGSLRLEDYMDGTDVDKMLTEITKVDETAMLDYADKVNTSAPGATPDFKRLQGPVDPVQARSHSSNQASASGQKSRDGIKHGLVSEMLQSPLPAASNSAKLPTPNVLSPTSEQAPQKSAYMAEFEKHLMATTLKESPPKHQVSPTDQSASSKLQSMLAQAQQANSTQQLKQLATPKTPINTSAQLDIQKKASASAQSHRLSHVQNSSSNILQGSQTVASPTGPKLHGSPSQASHNPHHLSSQPHKLSLSQGQKLSSAQPTKAQVGQSGSQLKKQYISESRLKDSSSVPKDLVVPSSLSSSPIDQEAVKQLHHQLMQLATASSNYGGSSSQYKTSGMAKSVSNTKPAAQDSVVGQLFKQPLPANMAAQQRQMQPAKTSLLKIDTQNSMGAVPQRHSPQDPLRMSPQGQRPVGQGQKQTPSVHMSGGSLHSPTSSRKSPVEMSSKNQPAMGNQLSPSHARSLLARQSPNETLTQAKRVASAKDALSRQKEVEKSILEKVIEEYQTEMKAQQHQQQYAGSGQHKVSPPTHSPSQGSMPRTTWQQTPSSSPPSTGASRLSAFSPPSGNTKPAKPVPHMAVPGYQTVKMSSMVKETPAATYAMNLPGLQQRSRPQDLLAGGHSVPKPAHSVMSPNPGINTFSSHSQPPAAHSTLSPNQHQITGPPQSPGSRY